MHDAAIYNPTDTSVGGIHAFFLVRGDARAYNLPPKPEVPTSLLKASWSAAGIAAGVIAIASLAAFWSGGRPRPPARRKPRSARRADEGVRPSLERR